MVNKSTLNRLKALETALEVSTERVLWPPRFYELGTDPWAVLDAEDANPVAGVYVFLEDASRENPKIGRIARDGTRSLENFDISVQGVRR